jgi:hypothetical protein
VKNQAAWTKWKSFGEEELRDIPKKPGVYEFRCVGKNGKPVSIPRLVRKDKEGIVYIGQSNDLHKRITGFWVTIQEEDFTRHAAGWTYVSMNFYPIFPPDRLRFRYKVAKNPSAVERGLLLPYLRKFMALPPLNFSRGHYPHNWKKQWSEVFGRQPLT